MRFRAGLVAGFATGYYLGAKAGHARYEQMRRLLGRARRSDALHAATGRARAVVDVGVDRAKDVVERRRSSGDEAETLAEITVIAVANGGTTAHR